MPKRRTRNKKIELAKRTKEAESTTNGVQKGSQSFAEELPAASVEVDEQRTAAASFPVVGIGASAGGLAAIELSWCSTSTPTIRAFCLT